MSDEASGQLTRDQERSLWLHRALLGRLRTKPDQVLDLAARNVERLLALQSRDDMTAHWLREWSRVLADGVDEVAEVAEVLTFRSPLALDLRQNSPIAGALPQGRAGPRPGGVRPALAGSARARRGRIGDGGVGAGATRGRVTSDQLARILRTAAVDPSGRSPSVQTR